MRSRTYKFGPGTYEMITLRVWTSSRDHDGTRHIVAEARGYYDVASNVGYDRVRIRERAEAWTSEGGDITALLTMARDGNADVAEDLVAQLVEWALEDYVPEVIDA